MFPSYCDLWYAISLFLTATENYNVVNTITYNVFKMIKVENFRVTNL